MATLVLDNVRIEVEVGQPLLAAVRGCPQTSQSVASSCPGAGQCKECIVRIRSGGDALTPPSPAEAFLDRHADSEAGTHRLACQAVVTQPDAVIEIETLKRRLEIVTTGRPALDAFDPWVRRDNGRVICDDRSVADHDRPLRGVAIDVGTTTVVMHVVDLESGETLHVQAFENPQKYGGSDVMHRISYDKHNTGQLHRTIIAYVNHAMAELPVDPNDVLAVTVAGNTTMRDLFFGLDVQSIGQSPFVSMTQTAVERFQRRDTTIWSTGTAMGLLTHPLARVYGLPLISNHVGADMAAVLATLPIEKHDEPFVVIDVGTNSEVVVGTRDRLLTASCPAGPAFEGGQLSCGTPACDGAITAMKRVNGSWELTQIGSGPVRGVCGSGLVDLLAGLRANDEMDELGRFSNGAGAVAINDEPPVSFNGRDASELAQAKAATALGQVVLLRRLGIDVSEVGTYYLAGAFASHLDLDHARQIGLTLPVDDTRVVRLGNASVEGAKAVLLSRACRDRVAAMVRSIEHVELEQEPDFFELFAELTQFTPIQLQS